MRNNGWKTMHTLVVSVVYTIVAVSLLLTAMIFDGPARGVEEKYLDTNVGVQVVDANIDHKTRGYMTAQQGSTAIVSQDLVEFRKLLREGETVYREVDDNGYGTVTVEIVSPLGDGLLLAWGETLNCPGQFERYDIAPDGVTVSCVNHSTSIWWNAAFVMILASPVAIIFAIGSGVVIAKERRREK